MEDKDGNKIPPQGDITEYEGFSIDVFTKGDYSTNDIRHFGECMTKTQRKRAMKITLELWNGNKKFSSIDTFLTKPSKIDKSAGIILRMRKDSYGTPLGLQKRYECRNRMQKVQP